MSPCPFNPVGILPMLEYRVAHRFHLHRLLDASINLIGRYCGKMRKKWLATAFGARA
jgi:hypothetical protein